MNKSMLTFLSKLSVIILCTLGVIELAFALWTVLDQRYKTLAYTLADVGYIDLWILRYMSLCLFVSSIVTLVMSLILIWGLYSAHVLLFIASTMLVFMIVGEFTISVLTLASKHETRLVLIDQLPKLVITYRQGTDERAKRALDKLQSTFYCCGDEGRLSYQNNVPLSCNMFNVGCLPRTMFFLDSWMDVIAYMLLSFSLIKVFIVLFFYSYLCLSQRYQRQSTAKHNYFVNDSSVVRRSSSFDSSSSDDTSRKDLMPSPVLNENPNSWENNDYSERQYMLSNEYEHPPSLPLHQRTQNASTAVQTVSTHNELTAPFDQYKSRKLSSISERTEKSETDDSEPELARLKHHNPKRKAIITPVIQKQYPPPIPKQLPVAKNRRRPIREDEHDSGVERSASEKSIDLNTSHKGTLNATTKSKNASNTKQTKSKSSSALSFSKVFITSVSQDASKDQEHHNPPSATATLLGHLKSNNIILLKPILKKSSPKPSPGQLSTHYHEQKKYSSIYSNTSLSHKAPKPIPRSTLKQSQQDESLV